MSLHEGLPREAEFFPDAGGIVYEGEVYYPAHYVLTRNDIAATMRLAIVEELEEVVGRIEKAGYSETDTGTWLRARLARMAVTK